MLIFILVVFCLTLPRSVAADNISLSSPATATIHQLRTAETTQIVVPWKWHWKVTSDTWIISGDTLRFAQSRLTPAIGFGLPGKLELILAQPLGATLYPAVQSGERGVGVGDTRFGVLYLIKEAPQGGIGLLAGAIGTMPVGPNDLLLGEGDFSMLGFLAFSITSFSSSLTVNIGYQLRPEHRTVLRNGQPFEQDDDLVWNVALRIPKDEDIAWSLAMNGTIGVATAAGFWPASSNRPLWIGGGIDYPTRNDNRLGLVASFLVNQKNSGILLSIQLSGIAKDNDEDRDGVLRRIDQCPVLREDLDGFEDEDGCPDHDNDQDGFPDQEDACPLKKADDFSEDGC
ncbi:MAG: hypothetical protein JXX29_21620 [Deltaproteobacteria bacterium]|nr:hypothetical protein [Deltaproteobacteria bacterium]MBN2674295.1 hypothetical protein [Deltaproteobacteria bacterium]